MIVVLTVAIIGIAGMVAASIVRYVKLSQGHVSDDEHSEDDGESLGSVSPVSPGREEETELVGGLPEETVDGLRRRL